MIACGPHSPKPGQRCRWWRKWMVRGFVFFVVAAFVAGLLVYQSYTNSAEIRRQVIQKICDTTVNVAVSLESAQLRLLGGISFSELRLSRKDDTDHAEFLYVPSGIIYHDKEKLLQGKMAIRKIELFRPRLRVVRAADGTFNVCGIDVPPPLQEQQATLVVHHGTVIVEDRMTPNALPLELKDCNFSMVNDPLPTLVFEGSVESELTGPIKVSGTRVRATEETFVAVKAAEVPVGPNLVQRLATYNAEAAAHARMLKGMAEIDAELTLGPKPEGDQLPELHYDLRGHLTKGEFNHARLPWPLTDIDATVRCVDGHLPLASVHARAGATELSASLKDLSPKAKSKHLEDWMDELAVTVKHVSVTPKVFQALPDNVQPIYKMFQPGGLTDVTYTITHDADGRARRRCLVKAVDMTAVPEKFPYPVTNLSGTVDILQLTGEDNKAVINLTGRASGQPVFARGTVTGEGETSGVEVDVWGKNLPLDRVLLNALPKKHQPLAESFRASGYGDFEAYLRRTRGCTEPVNRIVVHFHDARMKYDIFPYPVENVSGDLELLPDGWKITNFRGKHNGGEFRAKGKCIALPRALPAVVQAKAPPPPDPPPGACPSLAPDDDEDDRPHRLDLTITGTSAALDADMEAALTPHPEMARAWLLFQPSGRVDFECKIEKLPDPAEPDIDLTVNARGCSIKPKFFPYTLGEMQGRIHYGQRWVELGPMTARHGTSVVSLEGANVYLKPAGGVWAELLEVRGRPLLMDQDFLEAVPEPLRKAFAALELRDPLTFQTKLVIDQEPEPGAMPTIYWDGWAGLREGHVQLGVPLEGVTGWLACRGRHNGKQLEGVLGNMQLQKATLFKQPFTDVYAQVVVAKDQPEILQIPGLHAKFFGGEVYGPLRAEFGPTLRYEMRLTASQVKLEEFGRHNLSSNDWSGPAVATLYLNGHGADVNNLRGSGTIDVREGKMYDLPLLVDMIKVLGLRAPDRTAFEEAHAHFDILGPRVKVNKIELLGNAISLRGQGELNIDGSDLNLDFNADWARVNQLLPPGLKKIPPAISDQLLKIKMRGKVGDVKFDKEAMPTLLEPVKRILNGKGLSP